jgi:hypothetical protein
MAISVPICNRALAELRAKSIVTADDSSVEARECTRYYQDVVNRLLERHDWSFVNAIAALAELASNPRPDQWSHAYQLPADCANVLSVLRPIPVPTHIHAPRLAIPYAIKDRVLFCNVASARLEYSLSDVSEAQMTALFQEAVVINLAAKLAMPVSNDRALKADLFREGEVAIARAIADDRNRQPERMDDEPDDVILARMGFRGVC